MQVPRSGRTSPMTTRATYGVWGAFFTRCVLSSRPLEPTTWTCYSKKYAKEKFLHCHPNIRKTWCTWSSSVYSLTLNCVPTVLICCRKVNLLATHLQHCHSKFQQTRIFSWSVRYAYPEILARLPNVFQLPIMKSAIPTLYFLIASQVYQPWDQVAFLHKTRCPVQCRAAPSAKVVEEAWLQ